MFVYRPIHCAQQPRHSHSALTLFLFHLHILSDQGLPQISTGSLTTTQSHHRSRLFLSFTMLHLVLLSLAVLAIRSMCTVSWRHHSDDCPAPGTLTSPISG
ncbi:hypothetical protein BDZ85DRAFT_267145 [Elsinoe ampelina]|uniref:Uncharacterized protein n=1 Tax=Elsinoe ampelina TaxID=302913 RepID=A0A6A6G5V9_9PEZI|nr:hypothetical protein BDZ85DRAFT_267145 [Elsinoe ampelina]